MASLAGCVQRCKFSAFPNSNAFVEIKSFNYTGQK
uniref:Uncharacterized protein n=1 Tax=Anguilla anguilla TaxID=7936 RepID=A0A0E9TIU1_ANGAN